PAGYIIHQAGGGEEMIPVEINLDRVRREREVGIRSLGQPLKSFRDRPVDFPVYHRAPESEAYLQSLGSLIKPHRGSRAGINDQGADNAAAPAASPNTASAAVLTNPAQRDISP
ncbi:MAG: hypothetical protein WBM84_14660, partial [Sedimenticolaceae bacterium]